MDRQRQLRINEIHQALTHQRKHGGVLSAKALLKKIEANMEASWSLKTIRRDLEYMRTTLGMPVEYSSEERTFRYSERANIDTLPMSLIASQDVLMLLIGRQAVDLFNGTPWHKPLASTYGHLLEAIPEGSVRGLKSLADRIRFEGARTREIHPSIWEQLMKSLDGNLTLHINYRSGSTGETRIRKVDPYGLVVVDRQWQLVGWDHLKRGIRTFLISRIVDAKLTEDAFQVRNGFNLDDYLQNSVAGQQSSGEPIDVHLRFTKTASIGGQDQVWHRNEKRWNDAEGRLNVTFKTAALFKVENEVLGWAGGVEVIAPEHLRERVREGAASVLAAHSRSG